MVTCERRLPYMTPFQRVLPSGIDVVGKPSFPDGRGCLDIGNGPQPFRRSMMDTRQKEHSSWNSYQNGTNRKTHQNENETH